MEINAENKVILSIVSGTYNRLESLKKMIESSRKSIGLPNITINYEFVLVDGGSTDGTIEWGKSQSDIRLIEHGELLGAVKAFNDGAFAAKGDYVILANDDIEFVDLSIWHSLVYMTNHKDCAIGCFKQDRNGKNWHTENMSVMKDGKRQLLPYGQVCIVQKWIGDYVGWWGDYLRTYGGDNELSCNVYELGYDIVELEKSFIHDRESADDLRKINNVDGTNDPKASHGQHPDSYAWGNKWVRKNGFPGPIMPDEIIVSNQSRDIKKILYLPIYESGWTIQKEQKRGLREALARKHIVYEYDYVEMFARFESNSEKLLDQILTICNLFKPDIILTQFHNTGVFQPEQIDTLKIETGATLINWNGDFYPENLLGDGQLLNEKYDIVGLVNREIIDKYNNDGINAFYWQIGYEPDGTIGEAKEHCDIAFLANGYSPARRMMVKQIQEWNYNLDLYGFGWRNAKGQTTYDFRSGCEIYRGAKIALGDSQWPETGFVSNRIFQILCAGQCVLCHQWFKDYEKLGLIDKKNCIIWRDLGELKELIDYYLSHEEERIQIANAGEQLALNHHSFDNRVDELFEFIDTDNINWNWR